MTVSEQLHQKQEAAAAHTRSFVLPGALAVIIFAAIAFIQFSLVLGQYGFFAELALGIGFYYCWTWHRWLAAKADIMERTARKG